MTQSIGAVATAVAIGFFGYGSIAYACSPLPPSIVTFDVDATTPIGPGMSVLADFARRVKARGEAPGCLAISLRVYGNPVEAAEIGRRRAEAVEAVLRKEGGGPHAFDVVVEPANERAINPQDRRVVLGIGRPTGLRYECAPRQPAHPCGTRSCKVFLPDGTPCGTEMQ